MSEAGAGIHAAVLRLEGRRALRDARGARAHVAEDVLGAIPAAEHAGAITERELPQFALFHRQSDPRLRLRNGRRGEAARAHQIDRTELKTAVEPDDAPVPKA